jgi:hypothetical protein
MAEFKIDSYPEAVALYRLLLSYKYAPNPMHSEIFGSPLIAQITKRLTETLNEMEKQQGRENSEWNMAIQVGSSVWELLITNTISTSRDWLRLDENIKLQMAEIALTPFTYEPNTIMLFIQLADEQAKREQT